MAEAREPGAGRVPGAGHAERSGEIERPRLRALLDAIQTHRLTTITAGAGAGKTSAVRAWSELQNVAWHTVTDVDTAPGAAARAVVASLRLRVPQLSADLGGATEGTDGEGLQRAEAVAARLGFELAAARITRDVVLVLDDLHLLGDSGPSLRFVEALCRNAPPGVHLVLISRDPIAFPVVRHALEGQLVQIDAEQLAFTVDETAALLGRLRPAAPPELAEQVYRQTRGWAALSRLAIETIRDDDSGIVSTGHRNEDLPVEYLTQEVLREESPAVRAVLRVAAAVPWICRDLVAALRLPDGPESLARAARRGLYFSAGERFPGALVVVPMMRQYLERLPIAPDELAAVQTSAGDWYASVGAHVEAISAYQDAGAVEQIAALLEAHGATLLAGGRTTMVIEVCSGLPAASRSSAIAMLEGEARQVVGDWEGALACYRRLDPGSGAISSALAWRMGQLRYLRGELDEASATYSRARTDGTSPPDDAMVHAWAAATEWVRGGLESARVLAERALATARSVDDPRGLAAAHTALAMIAASDGDRLANDAHYLRALEHAERARDTLQLIRIRVNRGSRSLEEGAYAEALDELDMALRLTDVSGYAAFRALALTNRGQVLQHLGRLEEATADLEESRALFRRMGSLTESYPLSHLGDTYLLRGDRALSRAAYESAIGMADRAGDVQGLVRSLAGLARLLAAEDPPTAAALVERALGFETAIEHVDALIAAGWVAIEAGEHQLAAERAETAASTARLRRNRAGLADALTLAAAAVPERAIDLIEETRSIWVELGDPVRVALADVALVQLGGGGAEPAGLAESAIRRLRRFGAPGRANEAERLLRPLLATARPATAVRTMGGFAVLHHGHERPPVPIRSKKARDTLKMLIAAQGRPVNRDVLIDRLWPDDDPAAAANRLSVALSTVRSALDPAREWASDHFVTTDRDAVALVVEHLHIDVDEFLRHAVEGIRQLKSGDARLGVQHLENAEAAYGGDFLEEDLYEEWALPLRERTRALYLEVADLLAAQATARGDDDYSARLRLRMLERDPYHEPAHLELVRAMVRLGRHGTARRLYGIYVARMDELALTAAPFPDASTSADDTSR